MEAETKANKGASRTSFSFAGASFSLAGVFLPFFLGGGASLSELDESDELLSLSLLLLSLSEVEDESEEELDVSESEELSA